MTKTYKANNPISINIVLPGGRNLHISFSPLSNGSSLFTTEDETIQNALERHYNFGKLFRCISKTETKPAAKPASKAPVPEHDQSEEPAENEVPAEEEETTADESETTTADNGMEQIKVADINEAKEYLAEHTDITRSKLRSKKAIMEAAAENNIEFVGLEDE